MNTYNMTSDNVMLPTKFGFESDKNIWNTENTTNENKVLCELPNVSISDNVLSIFKKLKYICEILSYKLKNNTEIFLYPNINNDVPDILIVCPNYGIFVIDVTDKLPSIDEINKARWKSEEISYSLIDFHIKDLTAMRIKEKKYYYITIPLVVVVDEEQSYIDEYAKVYNSEIYNSKTKFVLANNLNCDYIIKCISFNGKLNEFDNVFFDNLLDILKVRWHKASEGKHLTLDPKQQRLVASEPNIQKKIKGSAGSGKTEVLVYRAVNAHIRTGRPVLFLTYNITFIKYIQNRIKDIPADFDMSKIIVINYHQFFISQASKHHLSFRDNLYNFDNPYFFDPVKEKIDKYPAIFIDEAQDYKREWVDLIKIYFLEENGEFIMAGDIKQNVYERPLDNEKEIPTPILGRWNELNKNFRFGKQKLVCMTSAFLNFFDSSESIEAGGFIQGDAIIKYKNITNPNDYNITFWENFYMKISEWIIFYIRNYNLSLRDTVILAPVRSTIREIGNYYEEEVYEELSNEEKTYDKEALMTCESVSELEDLTCQRSNLPLEVVERNYDNLINSKKRHFSMDNDCLKLSTIHSFKGWEAENVFLIIQNGINIVNDRHNKVKKDNRVKEESLQDIYTAITRAKKNLFIFDLGKSIYSKFFEDWKDK